MKIQRMMAMMMMDSFVSLDETVMRSHAWLCRIQSHFFYGGTGVNIMFNVRLETTLSLRVLKVVPVLCTVL